MSGCRLLDTYVRPPLPFADTGTMHPDESAATLQGKVFFSNNPTRQVGVRTKGGPDLLLPQP